MNFDELLNEYQKLKEEFYSLNHQYKELQVDYDKLKERYLNLMKLLLKNLDAFGSCNS